MTTLTQARERLWTWAEYQTREDRTDPESIGYDVFALLDALDQAEQRIQAMVDVILDARPPLSGHSVNSVLVNRGCWQKLVDMALDATDAGDDE